jgi:hypothetical protein
MTEPEIIIGGVWSCVIAFTAWKAWRAVVAAIRLG